MTRRPRVAECIAEATCLRPNVLTGHKVSPDPTRQKTRHSTWNCSKHLHQPRPTNATKSHCRSVNTLSPSTTLACHAPLCMANSPMVTKVLALSVELTFLTTSMICVARHPPHFSPLFPACFFNKFATSFSAHGRLSHSREGQAHLRPVTRLTGARAYSPTYLGGAQKRLVRSSSHTTTHTTHHTTHTHAPTLTHHPDFQCVRRCLGGCVCSLSSPKPSNSQFCWKKTSDFRQKMTDFY